MNRERKRGRGAYRRRLPARVKALIDAARSPFERLCLLKWSFIDHDRAENWARPFEKVVRCRYCGNWHLVRR
jgi:hypothetical protein